MAGLLALREAEAPAPPPEPRERAGRDTRSRPARSPGRAERPSLPGPHTTQAHDDGAPPSPEARTEHRPHPAAPCSPAPRWSRPPRCCRRRRRRGPQDARPAPRVVRRVAGLPRLHGRRRPAAVDDLGELPEWHRVHRARGADRRSPRPGPWPGVLAQLRIAAHWHGRSSDCSDDERAGLANAIATLERLAGEARA